MSVRPQYEDFEPVFDEKDDPAAYTIHVYLPDFLRQQLKVTYDDSTKKIKARGERPLGNQRWSRFEKEFSMPDSCTVSGIKGKFEKNVLIITTPKKVMTEVHSQEPEAKKATQDAPNYGKLAAAEPKKVPEDMPTQKINENIQRPKEVKPARFPTPIPSRTNENFQIPKEDKPERFSGPIPSRTNENIQSRFPTPIPSRTNENIQARFPTPVPSKAATEPKSQKGMQDSSQKLASNADHTEKERKRNDVESTSPPKPMSKRTHRSAVQKSIEEVESSKKSKEPGIAESASQDHWNQEKDKSGRYEYGKSSGTKRSKVEQDMVTSAKEVMWKLAKRVKEDESSRQSLVNAGVAAVVIVALGAYIAYSIGSRESKN